MKSTRAAFITNNGLADHIGVAQVLPYLEGLTQRGHKIACISVEQPENKDHYHTNIVPRLSQSGIQHAPIWRQPSTLAKKIERFAMPRILHAGLEQLINRFQPDLIHCRSYMPLAPVLRASQQHQIPFLFDMRGFWVDERCESGIWQGPIAQPIARHFRALEAKALQRAARIVTLTQDAKSIIMTRNDIRSSSIDIIPCSVNQTRFKPQSDLRDRTRRALNIMPSDMVLAHLGSTGPLYRIETSFRLVNALNTLGISTKLLLIGETNQDEQLARAHRMNIPLRRDQLMCQKVAHDKVPALLNAADFGLSFRIQSRSSLGVSATKLGEYMSCGLPVISNTGIGDIHTILPDRRFGLVLATHTDEAIEKAAQVIASHQFAPAEQIRQRAVKLFNLERACAQYSAIYEKFSQTRKAA